MSKSTFWSDGYRDAWNENLPSPPDVPVYKAEYLDGYQQCLNDMKEQLHGYYGKE